VRAAAAAAAADSRFGGAAAAALHPGSTAWAWVRLNGLYEGGIVRAVAAADDGLRAWPP
jgi:hypothetical protein